MPSQLHEILVDIFRQDPALAALLLRDVFNVALAEGLEPTIAEPNFSEMVPTEARTDLLITFGRDAATELVLIVEVQLRPDRGLDVVSAAKSCVNFAPGIQECADWARYCVLAL